MIFDGIVHRTLAAAMDFGRVVHGDAVVIQAGAGGSTNLKGFKFIHIWTPKNPYKNESSVTLWFIIEKIKFFFLVSTDQNPMVLTSQTVTKMQVARVVPASQLCVGVVPYPWPRLEVSHGWKRGSWFLPGEYSTTRKMFHLFHLFHLFHSQIVHLLHWQQRPKSNAFFESVAVFKASPVLVVDRRS